MRVMKFGGTSVGSAERFRNVLRLVEQVNQTNEGGIVVVLSAMSGVTNSLIDCACLAEKRDLNQAIAQFELIKQKHSTTVGELLPGKDAIELMESLEHYFAELKVLLLSIGYLGELTKRSLDAISAFGELLSSTIFDAVARASGVRTAWVDARNFLITDDVFGRANPFWSELLPRTRTIMDGLLKDDNVVITQGFIGSTTCDATTTLGRGGSDYTASILGVALDAEEIQIWTDVDGMMTADPKVVREASVLPEVSFQEASELAYFGAKVLHPLTIKPAIEKNIPVRILNTMAPDKPGTLIKLKTTAIGGICAIASKKGITAIFIDSPRMLMAHGFLATIFAIFDKYQTPIDLIATSEVSVSLTIDRTDELDSISYALSEYGEVKILHDVAIVTIVGRQFREKSGIAGQVFNALSDTNIIMISGGASDINLSFVVAGIDANHTVQQLHREFFKRPLPV